MRRRSIESYETLIEGNYECIVYAKLDPTNFKWSTFSLFHMNSTFE